MKKSDNFADKHRVAPTVEMIDLYSEKFSKLVKQKVIDSEWVDGVFSYLKNNYNRQHFFLITATPQQEILDILTELKINHFFKETVGSPTQKSDAIKQILSQYKILPKQTIMVGDSNSDYIAAVSNNISFVLRKTDLNKKLQHQLKCNMIRDFL